MVQTYCGTVSGIVEPISRVFVDEATRTIFKAVLTLMKYNKIDASAGDWLLVGNDKICNAKNVSEHVS